MNQNSDFKINENGVLLEYNGTDETMIVPDRVKVIGKELLSYGDAEHLKRVVVPEGVTEIKESAFEGSKIEEITLPSSLKKIGRQVFASCKNLRFVSIPAGVTVIEDELFSFSGIEEVILPDGIQSIGDGAFLYCRNLKKIKLPHPDTLKIGQQAFTGCERLVDERGLLILQNRLFTHFEERDDNLSVALPDDLKTIETGAFDEYKAISIAMHINCPTWETSGTAKAYGNARSVVGRDGSAICFHDEGGNIAAKVVLVKYARRQLYDYYGTACHFFPGAHGDLIRIKSMSSDEILADASRNGLI